MENLNAEQIVTALECCVDGDCYPCPYAEIGAGCRDEMSEAALALIKELTEENESLKQSLEHEHASFMEIFGQYGEKCDKLIEENERLRAELEQRPPKLIITKLLKKENENV